MKKDYYTSWTKGHKLSKLAKALVMIEDVTLPETSTLTGVPQTVIARAARETGRGHLISEPAKLPTITDYYYDGLLPVIEEETMEQRVARIQEAVESFQSSCSHGHFHVRCSRCMRVLGSEVTFVRLDDALRVVEETRMDMVDDDIGEMAFLISDRLNKLNHEA